MSENEELQQDQDGDFAKYLAQLLASSSNHNAAGIAAQTEIESAEGSQGSEWNRSEIDGLFCSICLDAWTNDGDHHISCLPCGHVYGMSCITKWLQHRSSGQCPQCKKKCKLEDIRKLFVSRVASVDEEARNRIRALEDKCASLEEKVADYAKKEAERLQKETEFGACLEVFLEGLKVQPFTNFKI
ncbi:E3 ubiquitin-protein ligase RFWD3-like [Prunus yedoensis var. nudiflora]|uniref:E3 ubiquitin-protein ligase RFWD3-like n=1 Tax=Prunus yedoensis var. nudiflora TaxID=2094558 RepID=A0A314UQK4_PRUYE|nr:E3 ubiquitin-protein ligase RFWD3-like [Prunus yedoensis var. nudiflora]